MTLIGNRSSSHGDRMTHRANGLLDRQGIENLKPMNGLSHRLCVAPMMDWTLCSVFMRVAAGSVAIL
jgi:hypothetical protein